MPLFTVRVSEARSVTEERGKERVVEDGKEQREREGWVKEEDCAIAEEGNEEAEESGNVKRMRKSGEIQP